MELVSWEPFEVIEHNSISDQRPARRELRSHPGLSDFCSWGLGSSCRCTGEQVFLPRSGGTSGHESRIL